MFARIVSLVQIAALLACPMGCASGTCAGEACPGGDAGTSSSETASTEASEQICNCCCNRSAEDQKTPVPQRCPDEASCQGICGGAVVEKLVELDLPEFAFLPLTIEAGATHGIGHSILSTMPHPPSLPAVNHGRFVRALRCSFLC